jgi:transcriptional regulator with XRE-family HTH domain
MSIGKGNPLSLADFLQREIDKRKWSRRELASKSKVSRGSLDNIWDDPGAVPSLETLEKLAAKLEIPLWRMVEEAGFNLGLPASVSELEQRTAQLLAREPQFKSMAPYLMGLDPHDWQAMLAFLEGLTARRADQSSARSNDGVRRTPREGQAR